MKPQFYVTGYPRSKSAWFANLLSWNTSFCHHDGWHGIREKKDFWGDTRMNLPGFSLIGNADPANVLFWEEIHARQPRAKWVVVYRDFDEASIASNAALGVGIPDSFRDKLTRLIYALRPLVVPFDDCSAGTASRVAEYCGVYMPKARINQLIHLQVQISPAYLTANLREVIAPDWLTEAAR